MREALGRRIDAGLRKIPCDTLLRNATYLDVFSCQWITSDIGIIDGVVAALGDGIRAKRTLPCKDLRIVPGFIDAHVHLESSLMTPRNFEKIVLAKGTTTAISDPHEIANVMGISGIQFMLQESTQLSLDLKIMLSSCVPATHMETNGAGILGAKDLLPLRSHPKALGLAEVMNVPGVLSKDPILMEKILEFMDRVKDGHCPLLRGDELTAYASTGISSCHESSELQEAKEKLEKGMSVWIREGSVAKDLKQLIPLLNTATSVSIGFCTDDRNPLDITSEGHVDHLVREAIRSGVTPEVAFRSSSWTVARHYGLDRGFQRSGAIAPGFQADLVLLSDTKSVAIQSVLKSGQITSEIPYPTNQRTSFPNSIQALVPQETDLDFPSGRVHVIGVVAGKIITTRSIEKSDAKGIAKLCVLERHGKMGKPALGFVRGFGENFRGAIASSVGHDSHNLIAVGTSAKEIQLALSALIKSAGGFVVINKEAIAAHLPLPIAGLMTPITPNEIQKHLMDLRNASKAIQCELNEPFLQLAFLSLPVIPTLKLTDKGLVDVEKFAIIDVRAA